MGAGSAQEQVQRIGADGYTSDCLVGVLGAQPRVRGLPSVLAPAGSPGGRPLGRVLRPRRLIRLMSVAARALRAVATMCLKAAQF
jgi:hypothetical protein